MRNCKFGEEEQGEGGKERACNLFEGVFAESTAQHTVEGEEKKDCRRAADDDLKG